MSDKQDKNENTQYPIEEIEEIEEADIIEDENQWIYESLEKSGLLEEDYEDYDEVYLYSKRKPKSWKPREQRLWVRIVTKTLIFAVVAGALISGFVFGFRLKSVSVTGNYTYTDEEILAMLNYDHYPHNSLIFWWKNRKGIDGGIPFIEKISVRFGGPSTVYVNVSEKMIIGCIDDSGLYMYFDNTGSVVESSTSKTQGIPLVTGLSISDLEIGDQLDINDASVFNNLYELSVILKNYNVSVDQIDYKTDQTMVMRIGDVQVLLGTGQNLEDKINAYKDLEPNLQGMAGKLHLENYDSSKNSIFFSKDS